jgi:hypothetical protein
MAYVIRIDQLEDTCELFRLRLEGYDYVAERLGRDLTLDMAQGMAEDAARRSGLDATSWRDQTWRSHPASEGQLRKLWMVGVRDAAVRRSIRTKGEAADLITEHMAKEAIRQYDLRDALAEHVA